MLHVADSVHVTDKAGEPHYVLHLVEALSGDGFIATTSNGGFKVLTVR